MSKVHINETVVASFDENTKNSPQLGPKLSVTNALYRGSEADSTALHFTYYTNCSGSSAPTSM